MSFKTESVKFSNFFSFIIRNSKNITGSDASNQKSRIQEAAQLSISTTIFVLLQTCFGCVEDTYAMMCVFTKCIYNIMKRLNSPRVSEKKINIYKPPKREWWEYNFLLATFFWFFCVFSMRAIWPSLSTVYSWSIVLLKLPFQCPTDELLLLLNREKIAAGRA